MQGGLIHETSSGEYHVADTYQTGGPEATAASTTATGTPNSGGGVASTTNVSATGATSINSHLDSVFDSHGFTREDVLVIAGLGQIVLWIVLLYLEVRQL